MSKPVVNIQHKVQKELPEFAAEVNSLSASQINDRLAQCAKDAEAIDVAQEMDDGLEEAQEKASSMLAPYRDARKVIKLKSRYLISVLKDKGAL